MVVPSSLKRIHSREEAPPDTYIFYNLQGGIYYLHVNDYLHFILEWVGLVTGIPLEPSGVPRSHAPPLTCDLTSTCLHSVILDFDYYPSPLEIGTDIFHIIETVLKMAFLPALPHFTYIIATRYRHYGVHIHLPEIQIAHDDYILLCESLQYQLRQILKGNEVYKLDILMNAMLPGAAKPNCFPYLPVRLVYVDERHTHYLNVVKFNEEYDALKKKFVNRKSNEKSLFRSLLKINSLGLLMNELKQLMMPVMCSRVDVPIHSLLYATSILRQPNQSPDWQVCASFALKKTKEEHYLCKSKKMTFNHPNLLKAYYHLKLNACNMAAFETTNHALKRWYERFGRVSTLDASHIPPFFREVHDMLQFEHASLAENPNPIKTIMQFHDGYYFLPVFYALCQYYQKDSLAMADALAALLDREFFPLLDKLRRLHPNLIQFEISDVSANTLHFCANNLHEEQPQTHREKLKSIVQNNQRAILSVTSLDQMAELLRSMQQRHLPIRKLRLRNALKKATRYIWNALTESWQELATDREITDHMLNLWSYVKQFYHEYRESGGMGGPDAEVVSRFSVTTLVSAILSDTAMERKDIQMDAHKWLLRTRDGVLDLLTGHIGGVVPELYLSDRKIHLDIPRKRLRTLCDDCARLRDVYDRFVDQRFFLQYVQALFLDRQPTLLEALAEKLPGATDDDLTQSMLHFYVNLCKCTSFEYELLLYLLDVLASALIGTNYERKFFVFKGLTRNGKSKLFELLGRVFGGYYHSIQSENLSPGHSAGNATPELASTLFSCRLVTSEELEKRLDENRVKQITGNSFVTFRNMYEQNSGGIPTAKLFATTNNYPECKASEAFKDRVVAIPFDAEFVDNAPEKTSQQIERNTYQKDVYVVEQSYVGCFFVLYYHLKKHMSLEDGLLHYRDEPSCVVEFTHDYLIHADIYVQFKLHMDVQWKAGSSTTMTEVKSAVRQYLKTTKNTSFHETDLLICFEKEFGELRQTDIQLGGDTSFSYRSFAEEEESQKKMKYDHDLVYYEGVIIKNLKKQNFED